MGCAYYITQGRGLELVIKQSELIELVDKLGQSCWQKAQDENANIIERASLAGRACAYGIIACFLEDNNIVEEKNVKN